MKRLAIIVLQLAACAAEPTGVWILPPDEPPPEIGAVVLLHGDGEDGAAIADRWKVPGEVLAPTVEGAWNASTACCADAPRDDLADVVALLEGQEHASVVMGQGAGGFMAWRVGCARPDLVSAVVIVSGAANAEVDPPCAPGVVSVLHVHGTVDDVVSYGGGRLSGMLADYPSVETSSRQERDLAGCDRAEQLPAPELGVSTESIGCFYWNAGRKIGSEHWRAIGWDHNPNLPDNFGELALAWATERAR